MPSTISTAVKTYGVSQADWFRGLGFEIDKTTHKIIGFHAEWQKQSVAGQTPFASVGQPSQMAALKAHGLDQPEIAQLLTGGTGGWGGPGGPEEWGKKINEQLARLQGAGFNFDEQSKQANEFVGHLNDIGNAVNDAKNGWIAYVEKGLNPAFKAMSDWAKDPANQALIRKLTGIGVISGVTGAGALTMRAVGGLFGFGGASHARGFFRNGGW